MKNHDFVFVFVESIDISPTPIFTYIDNVERENLIYSKLL